MVQYADDFFENKRICEERRRKQQQNNGEYSRQKLGNMIYKHMTTTMIGALDKFEREFGHLWEDPKSEAFKKWNIVRKQILDNGNHQKRLLLQQLENFDINWQRYQYKFKRRDNYGTDTEN